MKFDMTSQDNKPKLQIGGAPSTDDSGKTLTVKGSISASGDFYSHDNKKLYLNSPTTNDDYILLIDEIKIVLNKFL